MANLKIYKEPLQRLDYVTVKDGNKVLIKARVAVNLYKDEYIEKISPVSMPGNNVTTTFIVKGTATGGTDLYHFEYLLYAFTYKCADNKAAILGEIEEELKGGVYSVTTIIKKNPVGTVTNTIDKDGDIEVEG